MNRLEVSTALKPWETSTVKGCGRVCAVPLSPVLLFQSLQTAANVVNHCRQGNNAGKCVQNIGALGEDGRVGEKKKTDFNDLCLLPK